MGRRTTRTHYIHVLNGQRKKVMQVTMQTLHGRLRGHGGREGRKIARGKGPGHVLIGSVI